MTDGVAHEPVITKKRKRDQSSTKSNKRHKAPITAPATAIRAFLTAVRIDDATLHELRPTTRNMNTIAQGCRDHACHHTSFVHAACCHEGWLRDPCPALFLCHSMLVVSEATAEIIVVSHDTPDDQSTTDTRVLAWVYVPDHATMDGLLEVASMAISVVFVHAERHSFHTRPWLSDKAPQWTRDERLRLQWATHAIRPFVTPLLAPRAESIPDIHRFQCTDDDIRAASSLSHSSATFYTQLMQSPGVSTTTHHSHTVRLKLFPATAKSSTVQSCFGIALCLGSHMLSSVSDIDHAWLVATPHRPCCIMSGSADMFSDVEDGAAWSTAIQLYLEAPVPPATTSLQTLLAALSLDHLSSSVIKNRLTFAMTLEQFTSTPTELSASIDHVIETESYHEHRVDDDQHKHTPNSHLALMDGADLVLERCQGRHAWSTVVAYHVALVAAMMGAGLGSHNALWPLDMAYHRLFVRTLTAQSERYDIEWSLTDRRLYRHAAATHTTNLTGGQEWRCYKGREGNDSLYTSSHRSHITEHVYVASTSGATASTPVVDIFSHITSPTLQHAYGLNHTYHGVTNAHVVHHAGVVCQLMIALLGPEACHNTLHIDVLVQAADAAGLDPCDAQRAIYTNDMGLVPPLFLQCVAGLLVDLLDVANPGMTRTGKNAMLHPYHGHRYKTRQTIRQRIATWYPPNTASTVDALDVIEWLDCQWKNCFSKTARVSMCYLIGYQESVGAGDASAPSGSFTGETYVVLEVRRISMPNHTNDRASAFGYTWSIQQHYPVPTINAPLDALWSAHELTAILSKSHFMMRYTLGKRIVRIPTPPQT